MANAVYTFLMVVLGLLAYAFGDFSIVSDVIFHFKGDEVSTFVLLFVPIAFLLVILTNKVKKQ